MKEHQLFWTPPPPPPKASNIKVKNSQEQWSTLENDRFKKSSACNPIFVEILGELTKAVFVNSTNSTTNIDMTVLSIHLLATRPLLDSLCMFTAHCKTFAESRLSYTMDIHVHNLEICCKKRCKPAIYGQSRLHWKSAPAPAIVYLKQQIWRCTQQTNRKDHINILILLCLPYLDGSECCWRNHCDPAARNSKRIDRSLRWGGGQKEMDGNA